ncbi:MAG: DEAD/DEAH box helicase family protein [Bacteroidales bacterium]|jgi:superfamily II DNA/RNA helicase|nr:DEAD/DEAH box helicase family protein [Bacteroidales bacterium]
MSSKFFTNQSLNSLFNKFKGIAQDMANFYSFHAVVGFFRSSGYFKLRQELKDVQKNQILVGINIDNIWKKHNKAQLFMGDDEQAKQEYLKDFIEDVQNSNYSAEVEQGILQLAEDLTLGRVEMKIYPSKNLHAKFYLCLPEKHSEHSDGWVIMGSSNISESGLGISTPPRYELNVAMKDYDDVKFCKEEFDKLWNEGIEITTKDIQNSTEKTYIGKQPTPYELYIKVLIDTFGTTVEDNFTMQLPDGFMDLKYQRDAVIQGYKMLMQHNGFFLADVVGLGKTLVAAMIAKRFIEANGRTSSILVIYPPAVEKNWKETFRKFQIENYTQFVSNGSLHHILNREDNLSRNLNYKDKSEYDLVIVDEAHNFRSWWTERYSQLYKICKTLRSNEGLLNENSHKKIILVSATPLNNKPEDLLNQLLFFQNARQSTVEGVGNLKSFFTPLIAEYKEVSKMENPQEYTKKTDEIYKKIRTKILDKLTVRRTRNNILNDNTYKEDLKKQKVVFPQIKEPQSIEYSMNYKLRKLFYDTLVTLTDENTGLKYARYRAVEFLLDEEERKQYNNVFLVGENLKGIYKTRMVKRLESSFYALKKSLETFLRITESIINQYNQDKVIIAKGLNVDELEKKGYELDRIIEYAEQHGLLKNGKTYKKSDFSSDFITMLNSDASKLKTLVEEWNKIMEDPKLDTFINNIGSMLDKKINPTEKLVIFSESVDTVNYLEEELRERLKRKDILKIWSGNRDNLRDAIKQNFDANFVMSERNAELVQTLPSEDTKLMRSNNFAMSEQKNIPEYNILITTDVLAEGINLHRANVVVNYDTPWNATKLMQRIGRVNRIGSKAESVINYMFYPSQQGNEEINLYRTSLVKLQGFHSAFGEDQKIYTKEEMLREFELFNSNVQDSEDKRLSLIREVRELFGSDRELYNKIKQLPPRSRCIRKKEENKDSSVVFIKNRRKTEYYKITDSTVETIDFIAAAEILKADKKEKTKYIKHCTAKEQNRHFNHIARSLKKFAEEQTVQNDTSSIKALTQDKQTQIVINFLKNIQYIGYGDFKQKCDMLKEAILGGDNPLRKKIKALQYNNEKWGENKNILIERIDELYIEHCFYGDAGVEDIDNGHASIVISETFV